MRANRRVEVKTVRSGWRLLLLVDEAEELLSVARTDPQALPRLRKVFQKGPEVRTVLTATRRLAQLDERTDFATSPFLQGFIPPAYLTPLEAEEARALLSRGKFAPDEIATIQERTANHPFLLQLIASRLFESHDLALTLDQVAADEMVSNFFSVDFQTLDMRERALLEPVARDGTQSLDDLVRQSGLTRETADALVFGLSMMGYLTAQDGSHRIGNWFFERWLRRVAAPRADAAHPA